MALYKRGKTWWIDIRHQGVRIQRTTGTSNKIDAQKVHDQIQNELWSGANLKERPNRDWNDAVIRWCMETQHKKSVRCDKSNFRWLHPHLNTVPLKSINRDLVEDIALKKESEGASPATVNRVLALIRSILRRAEREWEWIDKAPTIRMRKEDNKRIRWISAEEAVCLKNNLPEHLTIAMEFAIQTGLREANITGLEWHEIDFNRCHAFIPAHKSKSGKAIAVPLNQKAMAVLYNQLAKHPQYVFTYKGKPIRRFNTRAWRKALKRAKISDFKWHDLRHTWASWHVQNGTSLHELQQLGGWASFDMVLRYAHLSSAQLKNAAERINVT